MTAHTRAGHKAHVSEGLRRGGIDSLPDINSQVVSEDCKLIDQCDVDVPKGVLQELGELRLLRARHRDCHLDKIVVKALNPRKAGRSDTRDDLWRVSEPKGPVAGVDALWAVTKMKVDTGLQ